MEDFVRRGKAEALDEEAVSPSLRRGKAEALDKEAVSPSQRLGKPWKETLEAFHELRHGDLVIMRNIPQWRSLDDRGWGFGSVVRGVVVWDFRWFPIKGVVPPCTYYDEHPDQDCTLRSQILRQLHGYVLGQWIYHREWFRSVCEDVEHDEYKAALKEKNQARRAALELDQARRAALDSDPWRELPDDSDGEPPSDSDSERWRELPGEPPSDLNDSNPCLELQYQ